MWRVVTAKVDELQLRLNEVEEQGFQVFAILPVGASEIASNVPRDYKSLEQRTTFAIVAHQVG